MSNFVGLGEQSEIETCFKKALLMTRGHHSGWNTDKIPKFGIEIPDFGIRDRDLLLKFQIPGLGLKFQISGFEIGIWDLNL